MSNHGGEITNKGKAMAKAVAIGHRRWPRHGHGHPSPCALAMAMGIVGVRWGWNTEMEVGVRRPRTLSFPETTRSRADFLDLSHAAHAFPAKPTGLHQSENLADRPQCQVRPTARNSAALLKPMRAGTRQRRPFAKLDTYPPPALKKGLGKRAGAQASR